MSLIATGLAQNPATSISMFKKNYLPFDRRVKEMDVVCFFWRFLMEIKQLKPIHFPSPLF